MSTLEWQFADDTVSESYVENIGRDLGFKFPRDYISCAAINNGANVEPELFSVEDREKVFGTLLSYDKENDEFIVDVYNSYKNTLPNKVIPFAFDPAGNLICFDYKDHEDNPIVVFWEHENAPEKETLMQEEGLTEEQAEERARENVFYVAATFTEFLDKLHD
ncbi:SMI1/KNR4 family protein [Virgibacillus sp. 179-BFC.A HS]|uniref:SMI1/KNR4 family protein n=1 Tax=Tigheibacillus jepli TaxID=3035914 RepID=A0ABU5CED1_9BACI|nr:SMI1/KNR4 family protein [Virgibacillus sp. 179-BFC.A HS]MDY0404691.1 SMI1/KNR4 family protein [Virgibacillus sp. 179-BFC.A HS]